MKKIYALVFLILLTLPQAASAATHYVMSGAAGANNGTDWTNAWSQLPSSLVRGDTYYIADGSYPGYTFDDPQSGSSWIRIKKATASDHGANTGWQSSYGDGVAVFSPIKVLTGYYDIDGQAGGGPGNWTSGHGFKIQYTGSGNTVRLITIGDSSHAGVSHLVFSHMELVYSSNLNPPVSATGQDSVYAVYGGGDWKFRYNYMHHPSRVVFYTHDFTGKSPVRNIVVEYCRLERNGANPSSSQHSEIWSARQTHDVIFRYNQVLDFRSTGGIIMGWADNWEFYGNVFWWKNSQGGTANNGAIGTWSSDSTYYASNIKIYNNTFVDLDGGGAGKLFPIYKSISNITVYNNMWYNSPTANFGGGVTHGYNWFKSSNDGISDSNKQVGSGNPFVNYGSGDFRLTTPTASGKSLSSPYNADMYGNARGADGTWDRGANEYGGTAVVTKTPSSPYNVQVR